MALRCDGGPLPDQIEEFGDGASLMDRDVMRSAVGEDQVGVGVVESR